MKPGESKKRGAGKAKGLAKSDHSTVLDSPRTEATRPQAPLVGHVALRLKFARLIQDGTLPSALLLAGPAGVGKTRIATEVAQSILCPHPRPCAVGDTDTRSITSEDVSLACGECNSCLLCASGNHPDLMQRSGADKESLDTEALRSLLSSLNLKAFLGRARVVIIEHAEQIAIQAANILLKSLEEPRPNTHFILLSSNPTRLPITVRSRCQVWQCAPLTVEEIRTIAAQVVEPGILEQLQALPLHEWDALADGSIAQLLQVAPLLDRWREVQGQLPRILAGAGGALHQLVASAGQKSGELRAMIHLLRVGVHLLLRKELEGTAVHMQVAAGCSATLANLLDAERLIFERNLTPQLVVQLALMPLLPQISRSFTWISSDDTLITSHALS